MLSTWLECEESWQMMIAGFRECLAGKAFPRDIREHFILPICHIWYTRSLHTLYISTLPTYSEECFLRGNPSHNPRELEIVIPTILYTIHCGFPQLLPLQFQILERLIAQKLTILILSVKWGFGIVRKYWKKPYVWWMQSGWIVWSRELEKTRFGEGSW